MTLKNSFTITNINSKTLEIIKICLGVLVLFAGSQLAIPIEPVPITMQTVAVMFIGLLYSKKEGLSAVILYTILGGMGLPMFQGFAGGLTHLYGSTAGYLFGFIASIYVMASLRDKFSLTSFLRIFLNCMIGTLVVLVFGLSWLTYLIGFKNAIIFGLLPFIIPGIAKAVFLSLSLRYIRDIK